MHKKDLKFALDVELAQLKFTYTYHSTEIVKARPHRVEISNFLRIMKIFKSDIFLKTLLIRISQLVYKKYIPCTKNT